MQPCEGDKTKSRKENNAKTGCIPVSDYGALIVTVHNQFSRGGDIPGINENLNCINNMDGLPPSKQYPLYNVCLKVNNFNTNHSR